MDELTLLDAVERYIRGAMNPEERLHFENLRKTNPEVDQLVVEHTLFLQQINRFGERRKFRETLQHIHTDLAEQGRINSPKLKGKAKVTYLWKKYKRVVAIAACIAGITAVGTSALVWSISPSPDNQKITTLKKDLDEVKKEHIRTKHDINKLKDQIKGTIGDQPINTTEEFVPRSGGTGFLIDGSGLMITNAHIVRNSKNIRVVNSRGVQFRAFVVRLDVPRDIAIIKIDDKQFKAIPTLPYGFRKTGSDIAEPVFTLGFPRDSIVYGEGYLSARSGYDTLSCQITIPANPGNSGGPVFNQAGEVIGILTSKEIEAEGAVFAVQSKYIYQAVEEIKKGNAEYKNVKISSRSGLSGLNRKLQAQRIEQFVFMVKGD